MKSNRFSLVLRLTGLLSASSAFIACSRHPQISPPTRPIVASSPSVPSTGAAVAKLAEFHPEVVYRRSDELQWQEPLPDLPLYVLDAVRTQSNATARIEFKMGSRIDMDPNTLIIIREPKDPSLAADQVSFRGGKLVSRSPSELWLLTSAALLKIRADSGKKPAIATISGSEGRKMKFELAQGEGILLRRTKSRLEPMPLKPHHPITLLAPAAPSTFGRTENLPLIAAGVPVLQQRPAPAVQASAAPVSPPELSISFPTNYGQVHQATVEVKGKASPRNARVLVNGIETTLLKGAFSKNVTIAPGENTIVVELILNGYPPLFRKISVIRKE